MCSEFRRLHTKGSYSDGHLNRMGVADLRYVCDDERKLNMRKFRANSLLPQAQASSLTATVILKLT